MNVALYAARRRRQIAAHAVLFPPFPAVALRQLGGAWVVDDANTGAPDGYFVLTDGRLVIDTAASSGLPISVDGSLLVGS